MAKLVIVHFSAVELYPPVQNLIEELSKKKTVEKIIVLTTSTKCDFAQFETGTERISIKRLGRFDQKQSDLTRYVNYLYYYFACSLLLIVYKPKSILYYETLSSLPVYLYKRFISRNTRLLIHYHEYTSALEYKTGMTLTRWFHRLEKWLYPKSTWVSHTNEARMQLFKKDLLPVIIPNTFILPNYPPTNWAHDPKPCVKAPVRIVYIGSLSLVTMYAKEFAKWVISQNGKVIWHLYTSNYSEEAKVYFNELKTDWIALRPGVEYKMLPEILKEYDVGVILYKGHIPNFVYNAPNKLFEYLACGLDVWFPHVMTGSIPYCTLKTYPKILALNLERTDTWDLSVLVNREGLVLRASPYYFEFAIKDLVAKFEFEDVISN
jgi:hypothetical protein